MPKANLSRMNVESLMDLRDQVDQRLRQHRGELQEQLEKIASLSGERVARGRRGGGSAMRGRKVPPKYRGPSGRDLGGSRRKTAMDDGATKEGQEDR